jgi:Domain of unknown function (DUF1918)
MKTQLGDELIVESAGAERAARVGTIIGFGSSDDTAAYVVHWVAGDYDSVIHPWPEVRIRHRGEELVRPSPCAGTSRTSPA